MFFFFLQSSNASLQRNKHAYMQAITHWFYQANLKLS